MKFNTIICTLCALTGSIAGYTAPDNTNVYESDAGLTTPQLIAIANHVNTGEELTPFEMRVLSNLISARPSELTAWRGLGVSDRAKIMLLINSNVSRLGAPTVQRFRVDQQLASGLHSNQVERLQVIAADFQNGASITKEDADLLKFYIKAVHERPDAFDSNERSALLFVVTHNPGSFAQSDVRKLREAESTVGGLSSKEVSVLMQIAQTPNPTPTPEEIAAIRKFYGASQIGALDAFDSPVLAKLFQYASDNRLLSPVELKNVAAVMNTNPNVRKDTNVYIDHNTNHSRLEPRMGTPNNTPIRDNANAPNPGRRAGNY